MTTGEYEPFISNLTDISSFHISSTSFECHVQTANFSVPSYAQSFSSHTLIKNNFFITVFKEGALKPVGRIFTGRCDPTSPRGGRGVRCSKTAFQAEKLFFSQTFTLQKYFFFPSKVLYFTIFQRGNAECDYSKEKKVERKL